MNVGFSLAKAEKVSLKLLDVNGRFILELSKEKTYPQGRHTIEFSAEKLPAGIYLLRLEANGFRETQRVVVGQYTFFFY